MELSVFVLTDGKSYVILPEGKDYKRVGAGDTTAETPAEWVLFRQFLLPLGIHEEGGRTIVKPTISGLDAREYPTVALFFQG